MLDRAGVAPERRRFERSVDARYQRQSYELPVPVPSGALDGAALDADRRGFSRSPPPTYGHDNRSEPVQLVSVRLTAIGEIPPLAIRDRPAAAATDAPRAKRRSGSAPAGTVDAAILIAHACRPDLVRGPGGDRVAEFTILVPPGWQAAMDEDGFVLLTRPRNGNRQS